MTKSWEVHWVPGATAATALAAVAIPGGLEDLSEREGLNRLDPGDPFMTDPEYRVDPRLTVYFSRSSFAHFRPETKRNYAGDLCLFFNFLWQRDKHWWQADPDDLLDFEDWRRCSPRNPSLIGGARWNRSLAALTHLYRWATRKRYVDIDPVPEQPAYAKDVRSSNVYWLTPRAYRLWRDVGLRGYTVEGRRDSSWRGRHDDRNAAYSDLLFSSGLRRTEGASLLTIELPAVPDSGMYSTGKLASGMAKSGKERTFYLPATAVRQIDAYCRTSRRAAVQRARLAGRYGAGVGWLRAAVRPGRRSVLVVWTDERGVKFERALGVLTVEERMRLLVDGAHGPEPLWLWLSEDGTPMRPHSWEAVYRAASLRCAAVLNGIVKEPPYFTPHMARHSFALYMLVALRRAKDHRFGLTDEELRDARDLFGDEWRLVKDLLGHASADTTEAIYLAPVSRMELRALLMEQPDPAVEELMTLIAGRSGRVVDLDYSAAAA